MRILFGALLCAAFLVVSAPASSQAQAVDAAITGDPSAALPFAIAAPRPAGEFVYGTHISAIDHGQVVATGTLDELRHQAHVEAYSLEDIFLQLTGGSEERELATYLRDT